MATTTNYGWDTPDDTDLVKDGAAAIRTLGSSVDTTTKALNPSTTLGDIEYRSGTANTNTRLPIGTTGQVLAVVGGVPAWATTADQTPLTTKGDLFTFDTADARIGVGANGTVLTADSAEATGLKWAAPGAGFVGVKVYASAAQTLSNATETIMVFNSESFDTDGFHSTVTNTGRLTVPEGKAGKYLVYGQIAYNGNATGQRQTNFLKNGSGGNFKAIELNNGSSYLTNPSGSTVLDLAVGDYVEMAGYQDSSGNLTNDERVQHTFFGMNYLGA
jgi:hypothetical protein